MSAGRDPVHPQPRGSLRSWFLPLGNAHQVSLGELIAILGSTALAAGATQELIAFARSQGRVTDLTAGSPVRSAVLTRQGVVLVQAPARALLRRLALRI